MSSPVKATEHGITCHCRACTDYWDKDHSEAESPTPPTPMPSEGPYSVKADTTLLTKEPIYTIFLGEKWIENFNIRGHADTWCNHLNDAHSRALASRDDAVRELVQAARQILMKPRECAQNNFGVRVLISDCGRELDALHAALANPALVDLH